MSAPEVTVVIPTRDRAHLLRDTVDSVAAQESVDVEIVIVDDGSTEEQAAAIGAVAGDRARVIRNDTSRGVSAARNQGIAAADGAWVAFLDDDDLWTPTKLRRQLDAAAAAAARWAYSGAVKFAAGPTVWQVMPAPTPAAVSARLADKCIVPAGASNVVVAAELLRELGGFDEELKHLADWDLWLRLLEREPPAAADDLAVAYRVHGSAMSRDPSGILDEATVLDARWRHLRGGRALDHTPTHLWIAMSLLRGGDRRGAARAYARAARTDPRRGVRGLLRVLYPAPPRPAHRLEGSPAPATWLKRTEVVSLPEAMHVLLAATATDVADRRAAP